MTGAEGPCTITIVPTYTESGYGREAQEILDRTFEKFPVDNVEHEGMEIEGERVHRKPALALTKAAYGTDLFGVRSHGYGAIAGMNDGPVATFCVDRAPRPILVHRIHES